jgi:hypothetical protein
MFEHIRKGLSEMFSIIIRCPVKVFLQRGYIRNIRDIGNTRSEFWKIIMESRIIWPLQRKDMDWDTLGLKFQKLIKDKCLRQDRELFQYVTNGFF